MSDTPAAPSAAQQTRVADALKQLATGAPFGEDDAYALMDAVMSGAASAEQLTGLLMGLRVRGESVDEITGFARAMREKSLRIHPRCRNGGRVVDTCGTGGAPFKTFNISTASAFVVAGAGATVAKHGNRSVTSPSGSADVLEALGARFDKTPEEVEGIVNDVGIGFLFAPCFHPAMKHAIPARKALGVRTVFNVLGPLTNPAGAQAQVMGVFDPDLVDPLAHVLARLGIEEAMVLHGHGGLDEASTLGRTHVAHVRGGAVTLETVDPTEFDLAPATPEAIAGLPPAESARELLRLLDGATGARGDIVRLNAACALVVAGKANNLKDGLDKATTAMTDGSARDRLRAYVEATGGALPNGS